MARWLGLFCVLFGCVVATADDSQPADDRVVAGQFQQLRYLTGFDLPIASSGSFRVGADRSLVWHTLLPFESYLEISTSGITQRIGREQIIQVPASQLPAVDLFGDLLRISLSRDWPQLDRQFGIQPRFSGQNWSFEIDSAELASRFGQALPLEKIAMSGGLMVDKVILRRAAGDDDLITFDYSTPEPVQPGQSGQSSHFSASTGRPSVVDPLP
ncbi:MAG: hypothetical protein JKY89_03795 [Immundisolibacteraceae bacterium]|nr:hypothetical protein [Immundisolibacteraceae bacterium]